MRSASLCVLLTLIVQRQGNLADDDFRPMHIPLNDWNYDRRDSRAGTLQEAVNTNAPPSVAAVPAHYWEDALRHSVYLSLVRDKIDQLIAKGDYISPNSKPDHVSKEVDDLDLWDKIKSAPFERIADEEPASFGDVTIMAKGRLMDEKTGFRFTEDEREKAKCTDDKCMEGVKAIWSVKRVRQRDVETSPGRYHYELTFSVISQSPKKQRKPYENPVRTFTVRESVPERVFDIPQEHREHRSYLPEPVPAPTQRPERAIWFHKNIVPTQNYQARQYQHGLDRIFSSFSFFSDEDDEYDEPPQRYRPSPHAPPVYHQYSKVGYVGSPSDQQKKLTPYPYMPHSYKYSRPLPTPPYSHTLQNYAEIDNIGVINNQYPQKDHRYVSQTNQVKTTRPAVLPTPLPPIPSNKNWTLVGDKAKTNTTNATRTPESVTVYKSYNRPRPGPMKINYIPDHVRPPIYNAPPGVFVTMDKKPFKPMPPMKTFSKPHKSHRPIDFHPSPQVLDMQQFSEPDPLFESFRPITWNYSDTSTTEKVEAAESSTVSNHTGTKPITKGKKPPKKHENIKSQRLTTSAPEIITVSTDSDEENDELQWANVLGAFTKTTPMASQKEKPEVSENTTTSPTSTTVSTTTPKRRTTTTEATVETTTTTTPKPTKRTRPPPKFTKADKNKKYKRITTTTTTTKAPERKTTQDLTPQASSAVPTKPAWTPSNKSFLTTSSSTTSTTTTALTTTTTTKATTTSPVPSTTTETKQPAETTRTNTKNRFRQTTLMQKGTSINHDKWSATSLNNVDKSRTVIPLSGQSPGRRKGSNFHGYVSSTTPRSQHLDDQDDNEDHALSTFEMSSTTVAATSTSTPTAPIYKDTADQYESNSESSDYSNSEEDVDEEMEQSSETDDEETRDHTEYIFHVTSTTPSEKTNEILEHEEPITTEQIILSPHSVPKNKTKCKKKKLQNATNTLNLVTEPNNLENDQSTSTTTTETVATPSIFDGLFGGFTAKDSEVTKESQSTSKSELEEQESEKHQQFVKIDDDLQDFLDSLNDDGKHSDGSIEEYEDEEDKKDPIDEEEPPFDYEDDGASARDSDDEYQDHPYSLIELMTME